VARINRELVSLGLPELDSQRPNEEMPVGSTVLWVPREEASPAARPGRVLIVGDFVSDNGRQAAHTDSLLPDGRARFSRVDLTQNISTNGAMDFIRHLSTYVHHGKAGNLYPNGRTVDWGNGSRRIYIKYYDKAYDIEQKIKKLQRRLHGKHRERILDHIEYLFNLKRWCGENGIVRLEATFKATELIDRDLIYIESWEGETMSNVLRPYQFHKKINMEETRFDGVSNHLLSMGLGVSERVARQAELIHTAWVSGSELTKLCGTLRNFNRYRKLLLNVGVDIKNPCDISRLTLRAHKSEYREISPPSWYSLPGN
jgi:II/X family phage/plasmid replication protein